VAEKQPVHQYAGKQQWQNNEIKAETNRHMKRTLVAIPALSIMLLILCNSQTSAQCTCMGGAAVGGMALLGGAENVGVVPKSSLALAASWRLGAGDTWLRESTIAETGMVERYQTQALGALMSYGLTDAVTLQAEIGYYLRKYQKYEYYDVSGRGFSHVLLSGKYNVWSDAFNDFELTVGLGGRIPLVMNDLNLPQHILPSSGAYGLVSQIFVQKAISDAGLRFILYNRSEINAVNSWEYRYGPALFTSLHVVKTLTDDVHAAVELRNELRLKDAHLGSPLDDSGNNVLLLAPQLSVGVAGLRFTAMFDYPVYRQYNGYQLANDYSFSLTAFWHTNLAGE
jgi:hypothetical protein